MWTLCGQMHWPHLLTFELRCFHTCCHNLPSHANIGHHLCSQSVCESSTISWDYDSVMGTPTVPWSLCWRGESVLPVPAGPVPEDRHRSSVQRSFLLLPTLQIWSSMKCESSLIHGSTCTCRAHSSEHVQNVCLHAAVFPLFALWKHLLRPLPSFGPLEVLMKLVYLGWNTAATESSCPTFLHTFSSVFHVR